MSTILIYTSPARGHLYPMMDIAKGLKEKGNRVIVQSLLSEKEKVVAEGIEYRHISPKIEDLALEDYKGSNPLNQIKATFSTWLSRAEYEVEDLKTSYNEFSPDLLIADVNHLGSKCIC